MKRNRIFGRAGKRGHALMLVLVFAGISFIVLSGAMQWCSSNARQIERNNRYNCALAAAEGATEKALSRVVRDFHWGGEALVWGNLSSYRSLVPLTSESQYWDNYQFSDGQGTAGVLQVDRLSASQWTGLNSQYQGLYGLAATYQVTGQARDLSGMESGVAAAVRQQVQLATIPVFQFAIFYSVDLEINPGANMNVTGRVHSNADLYNQPDGVTLRYLSDVTATGDIIMGDKPGDPSNRAPGRVVHDAEYDGGKSALTLPIGTDNSPASVAQIIQPSPFDEHPASPMGRQRYYNNVDVIINVTDAGVTASSGRYNNFITVVNASGFVSTNKTFRNDREGQLVKVTEVNVGALKTWAEAPSNPIRATLGGRTPASIFVQDNSTLPAGQERGVRLVNGQTLPQNGLTVATALPLYVQGHYNAPSSALGTHNTLGTKPASLVADAITVLSGSWNDANSPNYSKRNASDTTVNAAFLGGIVETSMANGYSGGVENFPRFLENWSGRTLTYNGSMVVMFYSQTATGKWKQASTYYSPPARNWAFDLNFLDATKLPPCTPQVRSMIRGTWTPLAADSGAS